MEVAKTVNKELAGHVVERHAFLFIIHSWVSQPAWAPQLVIYHWHVLAQYAFRTR